MSHILNSGIPPTTPNQSADDEIIPTAIVIKNIPFNVKRETLLDIIVRSFPLPTMGASYPSPSIGIAGDPNSLCF